MQHIFLSYARKDGRKHVEKLDSDLKAEGFETWWDVRDIDPAQDFSAEIEIGIQNAFMVAVCVTPDTLRPNSFVRREIQYALALNKPVIPLRFADLVPHISIINNEWLDFFKNQVMAFRRLCQIARLPESERPAPQLSPQQADDPFRPYLVGVYDFLVNYLKQTVFSLITLRGESTPDAVNAPPDSKIGILPMNFMQAFSQMAGIETPKADSTPASYHDFHEAFEQHKGRILLLGEPGAGKTTTVMAFARDMVAKRLEDPTAPLPIFAPIVTWDAPKQPSLSEWLSSATPALQSEIAGEIEAGKALLLLDGLDELGDKRPVNPNKPDGETFDPRPRFMQVISANNQIVISCRVKDYDEIGKKLPLNGAITLQPLDDVQMEDYLRDLPQLWQALNNDDDLREIARTPLLLSLFTFAFNEAPEELQQLADLNEGDLRDKIFETYVRRRYEHEKRKRYTNILFTLEECNKILGSLAINTLRLDQNEELRYWNFTEVLIEEHVSTFIEFATQLNIFIKSKKGWRFIHLLLRDYFAFPQALFCLQDEKRSVRFLSALSLGWLGDRRAIEPLMACLYDEDAGVRSSAARALGELGDDRAVEPLIMSVQDKNNRFRADSIRILGNLNHSRIVDFLIACLRDEDWQVRSNSIEALCNIGDNHIVDVLIACLLDENRAMRSSAASALGNLGADRAIEPLMACLYDEDAGVRSSAASALGNLGADRAIEPLIGCLQDESAWVRRYAVEALGNLKASKAIEMLINCLQQEKNSWVHSSAVYALKKIGTREALTAVKKWKHEQGKS